MQIFVFMNVLIQMHTCTPASCACVHQRHVHVYTCSHAVYEPGIKKTSTYCHTHTHTPGRVCLAAWAMRCAASIWRGWGHPSTRSDSLQEQRRSSFAIHEYDQFAATRPQMCEEGAAERVSNKIQVFHTKAAYIWRNIPCESAAKDELSREQLDWHLKVPDVTSGYVFVCKHRWIHTCTHLEFLTGLLMTLWKQCRLCWYLPVCVTISSGIMSVVVHVCMDTCTRIRTCTSAWWCEQFFPGGCEICFFAKRIYPACRSYGSRAHNTNSCAHASKPCITETHVCKICWRSHLFVDIPQPEQYFLLLLSVGIHLQDPWQSLHESILVWRRSLMRVDDTLKKGMNLSHTLTVDICPHMRMRQQSVTSSAWSYEPQRS